MADIINGYSISDAGDATGSATLISGNAITIKGSLNFAWGFGDNKDYFKFTAPKTGYATFNLSGLSTDVDLRLLGSAGNELAVSRAYGTANEQITYGVGANQNYYIAVTRDTWSSTDYQLDISLPQTTQVTAPTITIPSITSSTIFNTEGQSNNDGATTTEINAVGKLRVLADFSKAAYAVQNWENPVLNDPNPIAQTAYSELIQQGWNTVDLNPYLTATTPLEGGTLTNKMSGGFYTNGNAAALVARSQDALVLSFRGTNDAAEKTPNPNPDDPNDSYHPDKDQWLSAYEHYALFSPLLTALDNYVANPSSGIKKVYVTGHSLGGAMAIEYMSQHLGSNLYEAISFAAPPYTASYANRKEYDPDSRITQIEIAKDPVPMSHEIGSSIGLGQDRVGHVIRFAGDKTMDAHDSHLTITGRDNNHSMDYYRAVTDNLDATNWQRILNELEEQNIYLGGQENSTTSFTVASQADALSEPTNESVDYRILYGGAGNDALFASRGDDLVLGGMGDDRMGGGADNDRLFGGSGQDLMAGNEGKDQLSGEAGHDMLWGGAGSDTLSGGDGNDSLLGEDGNDLLDGGSGNDLLVGGLGVDTLTGGSGIDFFRFSVTPNSRDTITDFTSGTDKIQIIRPSFSYFGYGFGGDKLTLGALNSSQFVSGSAPAAQNSSACVLYNTATGLLCFDSNGSASGGITELATLSNRPTLAASDIEIISIMGSFGFGL